jgi:hypothetical protein
VVERLLEQYRVRASYDRMVDFEREKFSFQNIASTSPLMGTTLAAGCCSAGRRFPPDHRCPLW